MWLYNSKHIGNIEDFGEPLPFGFIYRITNLTTGQFYVGKKQILSKTNKKLGKKERAALPTKRGRTPSKKLVISESNWRTYWGSCKPLLEDVEKLGENNFRREIIKLCFNKKLLNFYEVYYQIKEDVLLQDCYNESILGKYFKRDFYDRNIQNNFT